MSYVLSRSNSDHEFLELLGISANFYLWKSEEFLELARNSKERLGANLIGDEMEAKLYKLKGMSDEFHFSQTDVWQFLSSKFEFSPKFTINRSHFHKACTEHFLAFGDILTLRHIKSEIYPHVHMFGPVCLKPLRMAGYDYMKGFKLRDPS